MSLYFIIKTIHVLSATILFGTGIGIAFFMFQARFSNDSEVRHYVARQTVTADYFFTLPAVIIQPLSGAWLTWKAGFNWTDSWLLHTYLLYGVAAACWLPVVWIQIQLKNLARESRDSGLPLPNRYHRLFRLWLVLGWPAFISLTVIFYLMVTKPA